MPKSERKEKTPQLTADETVVWKNSLCANEIAAIEISCALYFLLFRFGWVIVLLMAGSGLAIFHVEASMALVGLVCSTALLATALFLVGHIVVHDLLVSKDELYVLTNKRIMFIDQKSQKSLNIDSATIKVLDFHGFGDAGALVFYDTNQPDGATVILYRDDTDGLCQLLPGQLAARLKGKDK